MIWGVGAGGEERREEVGKKEGGGEEGRRWGKEVGVVPLLWHHQGCWSYSCGVWYLHGQDGDWDSWEVHRGQTGETLAN